MNADPRELQTLLQLADIDAQVRQSEAVRSKPPHAERVKALLELRQQQSRSLADALGRVEDIQREITRIETDLELVRARRERDERLLAESSDPKQAQQIEHEVSSLRQRASALEDTELELMERLEAVQREADVHREALSSTEREGAELSAAAKQEIASASTTIEQLSRDRAALADGVTAALLQQYERLAARSVGAARLRGQMCEGCRMVLAGTELRALQSAPREQVVNCPECGAILVREDSAA